MAKRQKFEYSCGAASLINAARHLGTLQRADCTNATETEIYRYSCGDKRNGYSLPSGMVDACYHLRNRLGIRISQVRLEGRVLPPALKREHANELDRVRSAGVEVVEQKHRRSGHFSLRAGEIELFVVMIGLNPDALHWLLHVGHNRYIDPADGKSHSWWASAYTWKSKYIDTGVSLMVRTGQQRAATNGGPLFFRYHQHTTLRHDGGWVR